VHCLSGWQGHTLSSRQFCPEAPSSHCLIGTGEYPSCGYGRSPFGPSCVKKWAYKQDSYLLPRQHSSNYLSEKRACFPLVIHRGHFPLCKVNMGTRVRAYFFPVSLFFLWWETLLWPQEWPFFFTYSYSDTCYVWLCFVWCKTWSLVESYQHFGAVREFFIACNCK
jgi:hypothetical protein